MNDLNNLNKKLDEMISKQKEKKARTFVARYKASGDGSSSNASLVSPSLNEEFSKKSRVYILKR